MRSNNLFTIGVLVFVTACGMADAAPTAPTMPTPKAPNGPNRTVWNGFLDVAEASEEEIPFCPPEWDTCRTFTTSEKAYINGDLYTALWLAGCYSEAGTLYNAVNGIPATMVVGYGDPSAPPPYAQYKLYGLTYPGPNGTSRAVISWEHTMSGFPGEQTKTLVHEAVHMEQILIGVGDLTTEYAVDQRALGCMGLL